MARKAPFIMKQQLLKGREEEGIVLMVGKWACGDVYPNAHDDTFVGRGTHLLNDHLASSELNFPDYESLAHFYRMTTSNLPNERELLRYWRRRG